MFSKINTTDLLGPEEEYLAQSPTKLTTEVIIKLFLFSAKKIKKLKGKYNSLLQRL